MNAFPHKSNRHSVRPPFNEVGVIISVNLKLLYAALLGAISWWIWPSDPKWWGFFILSILLGALSISLVLEAIRSSRRLRAAKNRWAAHQALGNAPKNARLAGKHDLQNGGMN